MYRDYFEVRFIMADGGPDEVYEYPFDENAVEHFEMFRNDDSGLYERVQLISVLDGYEMIVDEVIF